MSKLLVITNHTLTKEQVKASYDELAVTDIKYLPKDLKDIWANISPTFTKDEVLKHIKPIKDKIKDTVDDGDFILISGEFVATHNIVIYINSLNNITAITSTTERVVTEVKRGDTVIKNTTFKHVLFRKY